ncbi:hypothetical protein NWFMUON74_72100 (plasmid) [Nocardia wallacei]|uniref:Uncharacterized protein n=2 Tax=Nocardia wallacei TaxID=480035 RepID=A0A7G1KW25_9NOCA|nr:hypothetical protein NWFMUON74_72100 [Nocardia wallacei]
MTQPTDNPGPDEIRPPSVEQARRGIESPSLWTMANGRYEKLAKQLRRNTGISYQRVLGLLREVRWLADLPAEIHETDDANRVVEILREASRTAAAEPGPPTTARASGDDPAEPMFSESDHAGTGTPSPTTAPDAAAPFYPTFRSPR